MYDTEFSSILFVKIGDIMLEVWAEIIKRYNDTFCVYRMGDDLGFKSSTLISKEDIINNVLPQYKKIISYIKNTTGKPFLLHSCGNLFDVMDDIIEIAGINAKHSNEDVIAPFSDWVDRYGDRIALFGGLDCDVLYQSSHDEIKMKTEQIIDYAYKRCGFAFGTGNSVPDYIPLDNYLVMNEAARIARGE